MHFMRVTNRHGKGTTRHNFREFDLSKSDHIDDELTQNNKYILGNISISTSQLVGFHFKIRKELSQIKSMLRSQENQNKFDELTRSQQIEVAVFNRMFGKMIDKQNQRHIETRHYDKQRDILDYYLSSKTEPTECILQVGNHEDCMLSGDQLWEIYTKDYLPELKRRYGSNIKVLNCSLHVDEPGASPHVHERIIFIGHNDHGEICSNKNQALKELGFELPDPSKPEGRYNNRLMEYSKACRELWIECCQRYGLEIEVIPSEPQKHGLELAKFKADREDKRLHDTLQELSNIENQKSLLESNIQDLELEIQNKKQKLQEIEEISKHKSKWMSSTLQEMNQIKDELEFKNQIIDKMIQDDYCYDKYNRVFDELTGEYSSDPPSIEQVEAFVFGSNGYNEEEYDLC